MELQNIFAAVCSMTVTGSIAIVCVLAARLVLKRAPRVFSWALWLAVLLRLLCPVSIEGPASVLEYVDVPRNEAGMAEFVEPLVQAPVENVHVSPEQAAPAGNGTAVTSNPEPVDWGLIGTRVWCAGSGILLGYGILSYVNLKRKLRESVPMEKGVREADGLATPFVLGRTVYLPAGLGAGEREYILLHERMHIRHADPVIKALFWLAVSLHWFNPLVWLAFFLCGRDMELYCDEAVLKRFGGQIKSDYAQSLLDLAAGRQLAPAPLAFGEGDTGKRVKFVLNWKKTKLLAAVPAAVLCIAVLVLTGCDPSTAGDGPFGHSYRAAYVNAPVEAQVSGESLYTLTADQALFIREEGTSSQHGVLTKADRSELPAEFSDENVRRSWKTEEGSWWLLENQDGSLILCSQRDGSRRVLERTDLLGVTIRQPGQESNVEPVWYQPGREDWYLGTLSTTLVDREAEIVLTPETDVDKILVSEEYYEVLPGGETSILTTDYFMDPDGSGNFVLNVARRGSVGDDFAVYRVSVDGEQYLFRLTFPAVPGETSVSSTEELQEVTFAENGAYITLQLPWNWEYAITSVAEDAYNAGIDFWPTGREEGKLHFGYYPDRFAVCGTGLETTQMTLADQQVTVGTYDGGDLWDYISFGEYFAVWGSGHGQWWAEYGDAAMEILNNAQFGN